jgi:SAM-dependent methyltransferase
MSSIREQIESFGTWITRFDFEGVESGGTYDPTGDSRVGRFITELRTFTAQRSNPDRPLRILECGSLEGAQTAMLAQAFPHAQITAVEIREDSIRKAKFLHSLRKVTNVRYLQDDLDNPQFVFAEPYDVVFCVGLLYHLGDPARFLARTCAAAPLLWVWSLVCTEAEAVVSENGYRGRMLPETPEHPLSGIGSSSFIPTISSLADMLWAAEYQTIELLEKVMTSNGNGPALLLQAQRGSTSFRTK